MPTLTDAPVDRYSAMSLQEPSKTVPTPAAAVNVEPHTLAAADDDFDAAPLAAGVPARPSVDALAQVNTMGQSLSTENNYEGYNAPARYGAAEAYGDGGYSAQPTPTAAPHDFNNASSRGTWQTAPAAAPVPAHAAHVPPSIDTSAYGGVSPNTAYAPRPRDIAPRAQLVSTGMDRGGNAGQYRVLPNDNMWKISEKVYGDGAYFKALAMHNARNLPNSESLKIGDTLQTPPVNELLQKYPQLCPKPRRSAMEAGQIAAASATRPAATREYQVRDADTLFDIARFELGDASRWVEIYELNKHALTEDFNYLPPGSVLQLPVRAVAAATGEPEPAADSDVLTRNPGGGTPLR